MAETKTDVGAEKAHADAKDAAKPAAAKSAPVKTAPVKTDAVKPLVESLKADAASKAEPVTNPAAEPTPVAAPEAKAPAASKAVAEAPVKKAAVKKPLAKKPVAKKLAVKKLVKSAARKTAARPAAGPKAAPVKKSALAPVAPVAVAQPQTSISKLKETIMATTNDYTRDYAGDMTASMSDAVAEMQTRAQAAYEKGTAGVTEMTEFAKGNVEAMVESGKIWAEGVQSMGRTYADEAKSAYETVTADFKEMAAVKSPIELFQLQGRLLRRNFDAMVAATSKHTDATMKLANDAMAPLSGRMNLAAEKLSKVA